MGSISSALTSAIVSQVPRAQPAVYNPPSYSNIPLPTVSYGYMPMSGSSASYYGNQPQPLFGSPYSSGYQSSFYNPYAGGNFYQPQPQPPMAGIGGKAPPTSMPVVDLPGSNIGQLTDGPSAMVQPTYGVGGPPAKAMSPTSAPAPGAKAPAGIMF